MAYTIFLSICLLLILGQRTCGTPVPQSDLQSLYAPPPDPIRTSASKTTLQPSPTNTIATPKDVSVVDDN